MQDGGDESGLLDDCMQHAEEVSLEQEEEQTTTTTSKREDDEY